MSRFSFLAVAAKRQCIASFPVRTTTCTSCLVVQVSLGFTTALLANRCQTTSFAALVNRITNPVDARVTADGLMLRINENDFKVLVSGILVDPIRVQHTEVRAASTHTFLCRRPKGALVFQLIDTFVDGLAVSGTLGHRSLTTTTAHSDTVNDIPLLGLFVSSIKTKHFGTTLEMILPCSPDDAPYQVEMGGTRDESH